jgi:putative hydrolase
MKGMSDPPDRPDLPEGFDPSAFADTPLFRELQRVLASSSGPVNWELARQVGIAGAQDGREDPTPTDEDRRGLEEAVRVAELQVARFTGLELPGAVARVQPIRRAEWVAANTEELRDVLEPAAERAARAMEEVAGGMPIPEEAAMVGAGPMLAQLSPLLMGAQVGTVLGILGQRAMSRYDVAVPTAGTSELRFVVANMEAFERSWSLDPREFRTWVALHEVTHRFAFARPWIADRFRELLTDFLSTLTLDVEAMRAKIESLDAADPEALQGLMDGEEGLFGAVLDDEQRIKLGRLQAFMAAAEGYGDHVTQALGVELLPSHDRIREALRRHHDGLDADPMFERLLGVEMKREHYVAGRTFCDHVAELTDEATLSRMWGDAESMPSLPEIQEPRLWLARTV